MGPDAKRFHHVSIVIFKLSRPGLEPSLRNHIVRPVEVQCGTVRCPEIHRKACIRRDRLPHHGVPLRRRPPEKVTWYGRVKAEAFLQDGVEVILSLEREQRHFRGTAELCSQDGGELLHH